MNLDESGESGRPGLLLTAKNGLCRFRACPGLKSMDCQTSRVSTGDSLGTRCCPEVFIIIFTKSFTILAEIPLGNSTFMAKDGQDTSAGRPRCETSNFGIYAVLTLEADMVKTCENNKLVGIKSGIISPASLFRVNTPYRWHPRQEAANLCKLMQF